MERRGYSEPTIKTYISWVSQFAQYYGKSPELLSEDDIGAYLDYLKRERQLSQSGLETGQIMYLFRCVGTYPGFLATKTPRHKDGAKALCHLCVFVSSWRKKAPKGRPSK